MKPGETVRGDCEECGIEFEVTLEPKCKDNPREAKKMAGLTKGDPPKYCPFCGQPATMETDD